ncbi:PAS domain S-box protein [Halobellus rubicundus]|uniref:histidine kinase n=1 Tax=Halobellus rubicundus TaxID=2996466 RepID=A0ABD5MCT3_9EURY
MSPVSETHALSVRPYVDGEYTATRDELESVLETLAARTELAIGELADAAAFGADSPSRKDAGAIVFAADAVPERIDRPTVWVSADAAAAARALDAGAVDALTWTPGDDPALLAAKAERAFGSVGGSGAGTDPDRAVGTDSGPVRALERIDDGIIEVDGDDAVTYLNSAAAGFLDVDGADAVGASLWDVLTPASAEQIRGELREARETGEVTRVEVTTPDDRWFEVTIYPDDDGAAAYVREITAKRRGATDQTLYEYLVKTVGDAVYILDEEGRFIFVNDALCEITGYDREELLGSSVHLIKDDRTVEEAEDALRELLRGTDDSAEREISIAKLDVELITKDGERIPCTDRMTLRPLEDGSFSGTVGTLRDISRQRRRQRILNNLLEATQDMVAAETTTAVAERVVDVAANTIETDGAVVREHDAATDELVPIAASDGVAGTLGERPRYDADEGHVGTAFTEGRTVTAADEDHLPDTPIDASMYLPIGDSRVLSVGHRDEDGFSEDERRFLELLTATAESVFERVERDQERRRYEALVETVDDMLFTIDDEGAFTLVTESLAETLGTTRSRLVGTNIADVLDDDAVAERLVSLSGDSDAVETGLETRDGGVVPARISATPIAQPSGDGVVGTVQNIRELRLAQEEASRQHTRFSELFGSLTDPLVDLSFGGEEAEIHAANEPFVDLTDGTDDDLEGVPLADAGEVLPAEIRDALEDVSERETGIEREVRARTDGGVNAYLLRSVPYRSGDVERAFVVLTDVTEVKRQGTHLQVLHRLLRHNLRNRTNVIQGRADLIKSEADDDRLVDHATEIASACRSLVDTSETAQAIQRVLRNSDAESDRLSPEETESRLRRLVATTVGSDAVDVRVAVDVAARVRYDELVESALRELVENAIEYGTPEPDSVVEVAVTDTDEGTIRFAVTDDGPGIPETEWSVVAENREITQLQHASGLGLWLVKWVADARGGDLRLIAADGSGTTVAMDLPA